MRKHRIGTTAVMAAVIVAALGLATVAPVSAQYPPPDGGVALAAGNATPALGDSVEVTATVQDAEGEAVAGAECMFSIAQQPGDDASVDAGPFTTDAAGNVTTTLDTGSSAGEIVVEASCGELSAQVTLTAQAAAAEEEPAAPPASLPDTGAGAADKSGSAWAFWVLIGAGALVGLSGVTFAWRRIKE